MKEQIEAEKGRAEQILKNPGKLQKLIASAISRSTVLTSTSRVPELTRKIQPLVRMIKCYASKEYRAVPWQTIVMSVTALLYFVTPLDAIADFIPFLGFADDLALITAVLASISGDIDSFTLWEQEKADAAEPTGYSKLEREEGE
ncbi:MAG: YkvA family protein [Candidatus Chlorobium antarcticum]|jgi:uncharacterized membrane protein YkvA (DUF1232 family)|nr:YkvA family protein [Candidatus Chlorobium antarcticum]